MDNQQKVDGDEDIALMDVPISFFLPEEPKVDVLEGMNNQKEDDGDEDITLMDVPISFLLPQEPKVDVLEDMDNQKKVDGDEDITLMDVPICFLLPQEPKLDVLEKMDTQQKVDGGDALVIVPISFLAPQTDVLENMDKRHKVDHGDAIMAAPISIVAPQAGVLLNMYKQHQADANEDAALIEVPISYITLEESKVEGLENERSKKKVIEMIPKNMHYLHTHTFEQRRQNWIIKNRSRGDGSTIDYVYHHLETNEKFRSIIEIYKFVVYGEIPEKSKKSSEKGETLQVTPKRKTRMHGKKLIKHYVVGTCESCNDIYIKDRSGVNYFSERDIPSNIAKKRKRENEDLYGHQQVNLKNDALSAHLNSGDAALSTPVKSFFYLWDFELLPEGHNARLF